MPSSPPLPPLPAQDRPLLLRLIALKEDFQALAVELAAAASSSSLDTSTPCHLDTSPKDLLDLYMWSTRPDISAWLAYHRQMKDNQRRTVALDTLESIAKNPDNKLEQRRAASTILRALDGRLGWLARSVERPPGNRANAPPCPPRRSSGSQISDFKLSSGSPSAPPAPTPLSKPTETKDPRAAISTIARTLQIPQSPLALSTLHAHCAPGATIAGHQLDEDPADFIQALPKVLPAGFRSPLTILYIQDTRPPERSDTRARFTLTYQAPSKDIFLCAASVTRADPTAPWLLADLTILRRDSG